MKKIKNSLCAYGITSGICIFFIMICGIFIYTLSYVPHHSWNSKSQPVYATINESYATYQKYGYSGNIMIQYYVDNVNHVKFFVVVDANSDTTFAYVMNILQNDYPVGKQLLCYYNPKNPSDVRLQHKETQYSLIISIILFVFCTVIALAFMFLSIYKIAFFHLKGKTQITISSESNNSSASDYL